MAEQLWGVWVELDTGQWTLVETHPIRLALEAQQSWMKLGYKARKHKRHSVTLADIIEG